jgi:hypothetical protein
MGSGAVLDRRYDLQDLANPGSGPGFGRSQTTSSGGLRPHLPTCLQGCGLSPVYRAIAISLYPTHLDTIWGSGTWSQTPSDVVKSRVSAGDSDPQDLTQHAHILLNIYDTTFCNIHIVLGQETTICTPNTPVYTPYTSTYPVPMAYTPL